ncbi:MAG: S-adenosylmethionine/S-adenosylhomocysteine transporter [Chlamydiia bacterium]|nr:S-adenosylmethionine/S-adenosylhomocysteine transporter [Chlamydiia bacterium]MCH9617914.1 S-adenosylmethionine/S-adenosylhomocysteine transporter [Chlamydiia bacterium]MCH9624130.1 S-adenosylmethionine/S-adenosylhomocysteine transporter [Chlamydiia bacterium]
MILPSLLYFLWSLAFPVGKKLLEYSPPVFLTGTRMILGAVVLLGFTAIFQRKSLQKISAKGWLALGILGFFSIFLSNILEFWSLRQLASAKVCFLYSLSPFLTAVLSYFHFREKMTPRKWVGILIGVLGFIPVLMTSSDGSISSFFSISLAEISMFFAVFFAIYGWIVLKMVVKDNQISPPIANGISMLIGGALSLLVSIFIDSWSPVPIVEGSLASLSGLLIFLTIISNVICYNLYGYLLKKYTATVLSFFGLLSPIFASIHGYFILGEPISPVILLSTGIVLLGLRLVYGEELRLGYIKKKNANEQVPESDSLQKA